MKKDASLYLNYPGLKYLNKMTVDWNSDSSCYLTYDGLKYLDGSTKYNLNNQSKTFLSLEGLDYMLFSRMFPVIEKYKEERDWESYKDDYDIQFNYDYSTGEITMTCSSDNESVYIDENNEAGNISKTGMLYFMAYKDRGIRGSYTINENGEIIYNGN